GPLSTRPSKMARIALLDYHQKETDKPQRWLKLRMGKRLVRRGLAYWVVKGEVLRMIPHDEIRAQFTVSRTLQTPWPAIELPGLHFEDPLIRHNPEAVIVRRLKAVLA